jgi:hypothetical protein
MAENKLTIQDVPLTVLKQRNFRAARRKTPVAGMRGRGRVTMTRQTVSLVDTETYMHLEVRRFAGGTNGQRGVRFQRKGDRICHH